MKKVNLMMAIAAIAATSCFISYDAIANSSDKSATVMSLANLEALSNDENLTVNCSCEFKFFGPNICTVGGGGGYCGGDPCPNHDLNCR